MQPKYVPNVATNFSPFQHLTAGLGDFYALSYNFSDPSNPGVQSYWSLSVGEINNLLHSVNTNVVEGLSVSFTFFDFMAPRVTTEFNIF